MDNPTLARLALRVQAARPDAQQRWLTQVQAVLDRITPHLTQLDAQRLRFYRCRQRGWRLAAMKLLPAIRYRVEDLSLALHAFRAIQEPSQGSGWSAGHIYEELRQLDQEFDGLRYVKAEAALAVTTPPIVLEGVTLGSFELQLRLPWLDEPAIENCLRAIALEPHPAAGNSYVTHPHVSDERLCAGEAHAAMNSALRDGRLCDLFLLAQGVLQTYNADSPYVALDVWDGLSCQECGYLTHADDAFNCDACDGTLCDECVRTCTVCQATRCRSCVRTCSTCDDWLCSGCVSDCSDCHAPHCPDCLEEQRCPDCRELLEQRERDETDADEIEVESDPSDPFASPQRASQPPTLNPLPPFESEICHDRDTQNEEERHAPAPSDAQRTGSTEAVRVA